MSDHGLSVHTALQARAMSAPGTFWVALVESLHLGHST
ncbi:MAG: hypothetical protein QG573_1893 [Acidobacteriota bacterium]|nr:hypothetical protein [Acidobacteriota bacterium]